MELTPRALSVKAAMSAGLYLVAAGAASAFGYASRFDEVPQHDSKLTGQAWVDELLEGHNGRFYNELGMHKHVFRTLLKVLGRQAGLQDTKHLSAEEQLAIFLHFVHRALSNRGLQERFQRSPDTITKVVHRLLDALTSAGVYNTFDTPVPDEIQSQKKFFPYFQDCIGALDRSHIPAYVPEILCAAYRNCKGQVSQNVLAVSSMDMRFLYVLPGWEGSAADTRVYEDARTTDFKVPKGKYHLADGGYASSDALLVLYRGVRYHLKEWGQVAERPRNPEELFNLRHAQLRNVIERIFGVLKKRFKVLVVAQEYEIGVQGQLVSALALLHNFIRIHDPDDLSDEGDDESDAGDLVSGSRGTPQNQTTAEEWARANTQRDNIAKAMWVDYQRRRRHL